MPAAWTLPAILAIPAFASVWLYVASRWPVSPAVLIVYVALGLVTFMAYAIDGFTHKEIGVLLNISEGTSKSQFFDARKEIKWAIENAVTTSKKLDHGKEWTRRKGDLAEHEFQQLHTRISKLSQAPLYIDDTACISIFDLRAKCRRLKLQYDIQTMQNMIISYLDFARGEGGEEFNDIELSKWINHYINKRWSQKNNISLEYHLGFVPLTIGILFSKIWKSLFFCILTL